jgi:hypothetical protein
MRRGIATHAPALGATHIGKIRAVVLTTGFLATIFMVPVVDLSLEVRGALAVVAQDAGKTVVAAWRAGRGLYGRVFDANGALLDSFGDIEAAVEDGSVLARHARPRVQQGLLALGAGNERVYPGHDGWLFYRPEIDYLTARRFADHPATPEEAAAAFAADLAARGIRLFLLPVPGKPLIHPGRFARRPFDEPPQNPAWHAFCAAFDAAAQREFKARNLDVPPPVILDPTAGLWDAKSGGAQYLETDSHWTPEAMERVATQVADGLRVAGVEPGGGKFSREDVTIAGRGDTAAMLELPAASPWNALQTVRGKKISAPGGGPWRPDPASDVLLLGDSFSNIFSQEELGWGAAAGFPDHLSAHLGKPLDAILRNDGGASATRRLLASELARDPSRLDGKKAVVWQFAMRELATGSWEPTPLPAPGSPAPEARHDRPLVTLGPGEQETWQATILATGPVPRPGETPYADFLTACHIEDPSGRRAVVYILTMAARALTPAARLRPGDRVTLRLTSWSDAEAKHGATNRGELDDPGLQLEEPNFATIEQ